MGKKIKLSRLFEIITELRVDYPSLRLDLDGDVCVRPVGDEKDILISSIPYFGKDIEIDMNTYKNLKYVYERRLSPETNGNVIIKDRNCIDPPKGIFATPEFREKAVNRIHELIDVRS